MNTDQPTRVLLVEGPEPDRDLLWAFFNGIRCQVEMVTSLEAARDAFERNQHDLVVTDTRPPRGSGFDVVRELHELSQGLTPFLLISGTLSEEEALREVEDELQVIGLLRKPVFIVDLVYKLRSWLQLPEGEDFLELLGRLEPGDAGMTALDELLRDAGDLSRIPPGRVLYAVFETKRTGCLTVATSTGKVRFYFFRGEMVYLTSEREQDSLIHSMARRGMLEVLNLPPGDRPDNLEDEIGLLMATRALQPHKIPSVLEDLLLEILEGISAEQAGIFRLMPEDPPHRFMEAYSPIRLLLKLHLGLQAKLDTWLGHKPETQIVVRIPLSIDLVRWKLPSVEMRLASRLRTMVGRDVSVEDFLRVYGEGEAEQRDRVRAFLSLLTDVGYLDFRPPDFSSDDKLALQELLIEAHRIRRLNHFQLLRLRATDSEDKLKAAHLEAAKTYHPDRYFQRPERVRSVAAVIQSRYQDAYDTLHGEGSRKRYLASLGDGELEQAGVSSEELHDPRKGSVLAREAERFMKAAKWTEAEHYMREAIRYDSERAGYVASLGWIVFNLDSQANRASALDMFRQALAISNNCDRAHYYRGMLAKQDGNAAKAELHFSRALAANTDNFEAKREMRLLQRRTGGNGDEDKGGFLDSLFTRDLFGRKKKK